MKVPIQYKSSDRYNAGVDVIYDDESKLQYAPFIYASTQSGDNGPDEGGDEEGEDTMVVIFDSTTNSIDKSFAELKNAIDTGKTVVMTRTDADGDSYSTGIYYLVGVETDGSAVYLASFCTVYNDKITEQVTTIVVEFEANNETAQMTMVQPNG